MLNVTYGFLQPSVVFTLGLVTIIFSHFYAVNIILGLSCNRGRWHEINRPSVHLAWSSFHLWPNVNYCCYPWGCGYCLALWSNGLMSALGCYGCFTVAVRLACINRWVLGNVRFKTKTFVEGFYHLSIFSAIL